MCLLPRGTQGSKGAIPGRSSNITDAIIGADNRSTMAKERPPIQCHSCMNMVAHLYLAEKGGETILVCTDCKAEID